MGKSTISMAVSNSFLYVYQAGYCRHTDPWWIQPVDRMGAVKSFDMLKYDMNV